MNYQERKISNLLYSNDPIGTCCRVNKGMEDEYDGIARDIHRLTDLGVPFRTAYHQMIMLAFCSYFIKRTIPTLYMIELSYYNHQV